MPNRTLLRMAACLILALPMGCYTEVSGSSSGSTPSARQLARLIETEFAKQARTATASIRCPSGLTATPGRRIRCAGETSDGFTLGIAVLERGGGRYRWDVVESHAIR